ncbi:fimbrial protein [Serratia rubidaea]|uniref:fimbrial protein n=1 Tax=Serratia rubidaea TaxID=61652 RepID=UPI003FA36D7D
MSGKGHFRSRRPLAWYALGLLFWCAGGLADVPVTVKATLVTPACYIAGTPGPWDGDVGSIRFAEMAIDFGEVPIGDLGTSNAEKTAYLWFACAKTTNKTLNLYVKPTAYGTLPSLGNHVLATSKENLGIAISIDGHNIALDQWVPLPGEVILPGDALAENKIIVTARLVAQGDKDALSGGQFQASANFILHYL